MNHSGDINKMVGETPRTDAEYERLHEIYQNAERINGPLCCAFENDMRLCRQLERELNAANAHIKRLEEAGDALYENSYPTRWDLPEANARKLNDQEAWRKAKEAKP